MVKKCAFELSQKLLDAVDTVEAGFSEMDMLAEVMRNRSQLLMLRFKR